ncbi:MAG: response regulator [Deltaproteobacteria bacterium]
MNYQGIDFVGNAINVSAMSKLHIDVWTPDVTSIKVSLIATTMTGTPKENAVTLTPTLSGWNSFDIDLAGYTAPDKTKIDQIKIEGTSATAGGGTLYFDNLYFWKAPAVVGCGDATDHLKSDQLVTVSCAQGDTGFIYDGLLPTEVSEVARGTTFCVKLPVREFVPPRGSRPLLGNTRPGGRVLVVEDEHHLGVAVARALASSYMVELAPDAMTALERIESGGGIEYDAVLCDLRMPGMDGRALYEAVQQRWPAQAERFIFLTGAGFGGEFEAFIRGTDRPVIEKPFDMEELEERVAELVATEKLS